MLREELDITLSGLGLKIPEAECIEILETLKFVEEMKALVRKPRSLSAEPAHTIYFPKVE